MTSNNPTPFRPRESTTGHEIDPEGVNHPSHYNLHPSGVECIDVVEHMGFNVGNAIKYAWRADLKGNATKDLEKAVWYLNRELRLREARANPLLETLLPGGVVPTVGLKTDTSDTAENATEK